jgi:hypothetical protein
MRFYLLGSVCKFKFIEVTIRRYSQKQTAAANFANSRGFFNQFAKLRDHSRQRKGFCIHTLTIFFPNLRYLPILLPATGTITSVNTDRAAAFRAGPSDLFICDKLSDPQFFNIFEIFDHAHGIFGSIPLIQMLQTGAWELFTLKAKSRFHVLKVFAIFDFAPNARDGFIDVISSTAGAFIFFS